MKLKALTSYLVLVFALSTATVTLRAADAGQDSRPVPVKTPPPVYPSDMRRDGISGMVTVKVVIDESGNVAECAVNKSTRAEFETAALNAVKNWKFKPAVKGGSAVRSQVIIPVSFTSEA